MPKDSRKEHGNAGEELTAKYLKKHGYTIVERNYRRGPGEIDIIAKKNDVIYFVEVKSKHDTHYATPADSVTPKKRKHIAMAASIWFAAHGEQQSSLIVAEVDLNDNSVFLIEDFLA